MDKSRGFRRPTSVIGGRNQEKCEAAVQEIKRQSGNQKVEYILADLSCLQNVQHMAQTFLSRHQRLDVLINNAGIALFKKQTSVDGHELTFATNYLGPFLLTNLLLEVLKVSAPARIVTVSSLAHFTKETAYMHDQTDWTSSGRKITQCPCIPTLDT